MFMRRYYNPPDLFDGAPLRRMRRRLMKPPNLRMAGQPPALPRNYIPSDMWPGMAENWLAPRPGEMPTGEPPVAPELTYEDYKAQPPSLRLAGVQPSEMSPYEIEEYANEMVAQRKAQKAQRMQELYEQYQAEHPQPRMGVSEERRGPRVRAIDMMRLGRGRVSPEQLAGIREARWEKAPELFPRTPEYGEVELARRAGITGFLPEHQFEAPDLEADIGRFAKILPPDLQLARARHKYAMEHPEGMAPRLELARRVETFGEPPKLYFEKPTPALTEAEIADEALKRKTAQARYKLLEKELDPKETYPEDYLSALEEAVEVISKGADPYETFREISVLFPQYSAELKRILLSSSGEGLLDRILYNR